VPKLAGSCRAGSLSSPRRSRIGAAARTAARAIGTAIVIALAALSLAQPSYAATYQAPGSIASDCSTDVTQQVLSWVASVPDNSTLSFASGGCYRIEETLELTDRNGLTFEGNGATFKATTIGDTWRSQWRLIGGSQIVFRNMNVRGANPAGGTFVSALQHQHAFDLNGASYVELDRTRSSDVYGDCVYVTRRWDGGQAWSSNVNVHDGSCVANGRMGIAVVAGRDVVVERTSLSQIGRTAFDIEPNGTGFGAQNVTFRNNQVSGALPGGFFTAIGDGPIASVTVSNNTTSGVGMYMAVLAPSGQRRSQITISGNSSDTGYYAAGSVAMDFERVDGLTVTGNSIPLSGPNMALAWVSESCDVDVSGNSFPGGVAEARISPYSSCATTSPPPTQPPPPTPAPNQPPSVLLTAPSAGSTFSSRLALAAEARDDRGVSRVEFWVGGKLRNTDSSTPYSYTWRPRHKDAYGQYAVTAKAFDAAGLSASASVTVMRLANTSTTLKLGDGKPKASSSDSSATTHARGRVKGARSGWTVLALERLDRTTGTWAKASARKLRVSRRGRFGVRLTGLAGGLWRARAVFTGTRRGAPSVSPYRHFRAR